MENILNYVPSLWKLFQLGSSELDTKYSKLIKILIFGFFVANSLAYNAICIAELFIPTLTMDQALVLIVNISINTRYVLNYSNTFLNIKKIHNVFKKLPQSYTVQEAEKYEIRGRLLRSRLPSIGAFLVTFLTFVVMTIKEGLPGFAQLMIATDRMFQANTIGKGVLEVWITLCVMKFLACLVLYEAMLYGSIIVLTVEFRILTENVEKIREKLEKDAQKVKNPTLHLEIVKLIDMHAQLLEVRDDLEEIFPPTFLVNMTSGLITICFEELGIILIKGIELRMAFIVSVISQILMIFIQCFYCQKLKDASLEVSNAIYDCKWEDVEDVKLKKHFLLILLRSQKSKTLTCWKFAENSYELFASVSSLQV